MLLALRVLLVATFTVLLRTPTLLAAEVLVSRAADDAGWRLELGRETPGATGKLGEAADPERGGRLRVDYDFAGGGAYVGASFQTEIAAAEKIAFLVRFPMDRGGMLRLRDATGQEHLAGFEATAGRWQRVEISLNPDAFRHWGGANDGRFHFPLQRVLIGIQQWGSKGGHFLLSDVSVLAPRVSPEAGWRLAVLPGPPSGVAFPGERATYRIRLENLLREPRAAEMRLSTARHGGRESHRKWTLTMPAWGTATQQVDLSTTEPGYEALQVTVVADGATVATAESALAVVRRPPNYGKDDPSSYFGAMFAPDPEAAERLGCKAVRPQAYWGYMTHREGVYNWEVQDRAVDEARRHGMQVVLTIRPEVRPGWARWKDLRELIQPEHLPAYRQFVRDCVERYRGKLAAVEITNEPDLTLFSQPGYSFEEGVAIGAALLRAGYEVTKEIAPSLPVIGLDVSGVDFNQNLRYTDAVLQRAAPFCDIFGGHPYSNVRYIGGGKRGESPEASGVAPKLLAGLEVMAKHGRPRRIWATELGWGLSPSEPAAGEPSLQYAAIVAQGLILCHTIPEVEKMFWFCLKQGNPERGYLYGLFRGEPGYPLPAASAYAACASLLHHAKPVRSFDLGPSARAWRFDREADGLSVIALWAAEEELRLAVSAPRAAEAADSFGRTLSRGPALDITFGALPVYLAVPLSEMPRFEPQLLKARAQPRYPVTIRAAYLTTTANVRVELFNHLSAPTTAALRLGNHSRRQTAPSGPSRVDLPLAKPLAPGEERSIVVDAEAGGARRSARVQTGLIPLYRAKADKAEGTLAWTAALAPIRLDERRHILPPDPTVGWNGPADLSVDAWLAWNDERLFFAARVTDDAHAAPNDRENGFWNSDSVQLAVDLGNNSLVGYDEDDREIGLVLGAGGPKAYLTHPKPYQPLACDLQIRRAGTATLYEAAIPWSALGIAPRAGQVLAINFIANDNDGAGRGYWMGLTPGIGESKSPEFFRRFVLMAGGAPN